MLLIGNNKVWVSLLAAGVEFLLSPLTPEDRDAALAESEIAGEPEANEARERAFRDAVGRRAVHGWKGVLFVNAVGDVEPLPFTPENVSLVMADAVASEFITARALGLGLKVFESLEEAGNALRTGFCGTAKVDPST